MNSESANILNSFGVDRVKFYYRKSRLLGNIFTACLLLGNNDKPMARGLSICSVRDSHNKELARVLSMGRAIKALKKKTSGSPINNDIENRSQLWGTVNRVYRKTSKNEKEFNELKTEAEQFDLHFEEINNKNGSFISVYIPMYYPIERTSYEFGYKYEYEPVLTDEEIKIVGKKK